MITANVPVTDVRRAAMYASGIGPVTKTALTTGSTWTASPTALIMTMHTRSSFTDFKRILGYPITAPTTRIVLFCVTAATAARR